MTRAEMIRDLGEFVERLNAEGVSDELMIYFLSAPREMITAGMLRAILAELRRVEVSVLPETAEMLRVEAERLGCTKASLAAAILDAVVDFSAAADRLPPDEVRAIYDGTLRRLQQLAEANEDVPR